MSEPRRANRRHSAAADVGHNPDGYFPPGSVSRKVIGDPAALVGGISALFLQTLHPLALAGVLQHSTFDTDFWPRLQRTAAYVTTVAFGSAAEADRVVARVRAMHRKVRGTDPVTGGHYSADDPELLRWVHVTEVTSFATAVHRVGRIDDAEHDAFLAEQVRAGALLGARDLPASRTEIADYFRKVRPALLASASARRAATRLLAAPLPRRIELLTPARPAWTTVATTAFALQPAWARRMYGLPGVGLTDALTDAAATVALRGVRLGLLGIRTASRRPAPPR